jgi:hypothetical protein
MKYALPILILMIAAGAALSVDHTSVGWKDEAAVKSPEWSTKRLN